MSEYTHKDIKTIDELIDHIRQNVGMYAGETETPLHLFEECFTNSLDEAITGYANIIAININSKENTYEIVDNGRGIPIDNDVPISISTKFSGGKFKNSKTAYKISCLKGDTKILLLDGSNITIEEMSKNPDKEYWGLASTLDGKFKATKLLYPQITGYTKEMVRVYLDNGEFEECTPDHLWLMRDGTYKEAKDLTKNDSLMPCYQKEEKGYKLIRPNYTYEYERNIKLEFRSYVPLHKVVYESLFEKIPKFYCVHHKDMNKINNTPSNFELLHNNEHLAQHTKINSENGTVYVDSLINYNKSKKGRDKSRENCYKYTIPAAKEYCKTEEHKSAKRKLMTEYNKNVDQKYLQKCKILKHCKKLLSNGYDINGYNWKIDKPGRTLTLQTALKYFDNIEQLVHESNEYNHLVTKIEFITYDEEIPVYDINSPEYCNFVLESGAVVHNSGRHGVGLVVVNALSSFYQIEVYRDKKYGKFRFDDGKLNENIIEKYDNKIPFSTKICFKPDEKYFNEKTIPFEKIRSRLLTASVELPDCTFVLNYDDKREVIKLDKYNFFKNNCLMNDNEYTDIIELETKDKYEKFDILLSYSKNGTVAQRILTSLNVLPVEGGGTHVNIFINILKDVLTTKAKKLGYKIQPQDVLVRLRSYLSLYLRDAEFGGQTKEKLTNRISYFDKLGKKIKSSLENKFQKDEDLLIDILETLHLYRKNLDSKKFKNKINGKKRGSTKFTKLKDCSSNIGELFATEGDSAGGTLTESRDPSIHAILPLKGKIPSIMNKETALKNKEVKELIQTLGTGIGPDFDITKLRYNKIIGLMDADPDGSHIFVLLTMILYTLTPEIIKQGHFYLVRTPLRAINEKNNFIPLWSTEEYEEAVRNNRRITRFKGLGELNPWQLKICALDQNTRRLIQVQYPEDDNGKSLLKIFEDVDERRKLLTNDDITLFKDI